MDRSSFKWVLIEFPSCFFDHWEMCPFVLAFFKIKVGAYWWTALERLWPCSLVRNRRVRFRFFARGSRSFITVRSRTDEPHSTELNRIFVLYFLFLFLFFCLLTSFKSHPSDFDRSLYLPPFFLRLASGCWWFSFKKKSCSLTFLFCFVFSCCCCCCFSLLRTRTLFRCNSRRIRCGFSGLSGLAADSIADSVRIRCGFGADCRRAATSATPLFLAARRPPFRRSNRRHPTRPASEKVSNVIVLFVCLFVCFFTFFSFSFPVSFCSAHQSRHPIGMAIDDSPSVIKGNSIWAHFFFKSGLVAFFSVHEECVNSWSI